MRRLFVVFICLFLMSCVQTTQDEAQPEYGVIVVGQPSYFSHVKTFSWHPVAAKAFLDSNNSGRKALRVYKEAIENELMDKGYQYLHASNTDVVVGFGLAQESQLSDETLYRGTSLSTGVETFYYDNKEAEKGSVYIVFYGRNLNIPDWRVLAQGAMATKFDEEERINRAKQVVSMMLRKVPNAN